MKKGLIEYRSGYKYQLAAEYSVYVDIQPKEEIIDDFLELDTTGLLTIKKGYAWDGPSGPAIDTKNFMRGSLVHDALYQLIRRGLLSMSCRKAADMELRRICLEDGMWRIRAWWVYRAVSRCARPCADPKSKRKVYTAP